MPQLSPLVKRATDPHQYDNADISWASQAGLDSPSRQFLWDSLALIPEDIAGKRVLEIGAGAGWFLAELQRYNPASLLGIEPSAKSCALARELYPTITVRESSFADFSSTERFDRIFCLMVITHLPSLAEFFAKTYGLLTTGGRLYVSFTDFDYTRRPRFNYDLTIEDHGSDEYAIMVQRPYGAMAEIIRHPRLMKKEAEHAGFVVVEEREIVPTPDLLARETKYEKFRGVPIAEVMVFEKK